MVKKYLLKEKVKVKDYEEFNNDYALDLMKISLNSTEIYRILVKYDLSKVDNMVKHVKYSEDFIKDISNIIDKLNKKMDYDTNYNDISLNNIINSLY